MTSIVYAMKREENPEDVENTLIRLKPGSWRQSLSDIVIGENHQFKDLQSTLSWYLKLVELQAFYLSNNVFDTGICPSQYVIVNGQLMRKSDAPFLYYFCGVFSGKSAIGNNEILPQFQQCLAPEIKVRKSRWGHHKCCNTFNVEKAVVYMVAKVGARILQYFVQNGLLICLRFSQYLLRNPLKRGSLQMLAEHIRMEMKENQYTSRRPDLLREEDFQNADKENDDEIEIDFEIDDEFNDAMDKQSAKNKLRAYQQQQVPLGAFTNEEMKVGDSKIYRWRQPEEPVQMLLDPIPKDDESIIFEEDPSAFEFEFDQKDTQGDDKTFCLRKVANLKGNRSVLISSITFTEGDESEIMESEAFIAEIMNFQGSEEEATDAMDYFEFDQPQPLDDAIEILGLWL